MLHFVKETIVRLAQGQVEFVVIGGISAVLQGAPIVTVDLDICYRRTPANLARLAAALAPLQPRLRGLPPGLPATFDEHALQLGTNFTLQVGDDQLDLLGEVSPLGGYDQIVGRAHDLPMSGVLVKVLSLADLIKIKEFVGRPKDLAVVPVLKATLELQQQRERPPNDPASQS